MITLSIFADYHQVILEDSVAAEAEGWDLPWSDEAVARMLAVAPRAIVSELPVEVLADRRHGRP